MKKIFLLLTVFISAVCFGQRPRQNIDVSDSTYALVAAILQPSFDTTSHTNHWNIIEASDHSKIHFKDSVVSDANTVTVFFDTIYAKVITFLIVQDEHTNRLSETTAHFEGQAGAQYYNNGAFMAGASVSLTSATITFSNSRSLGFLVWYNGSAWEVDDAPYNAINMSVSTPPTVTYSGGRLRIQNLPFNMRSYPVVTEYAPNGTSQLVSYIPSVEYISPTWFDIYWWDATAATKFTASTPTTNMGVYVNFGDVFAGCNPQTEDMGPNSNWWIIAVLKK